MSRSYTNYPLLASGGQSPVIVTRQLYHGSSESWAPGKILMKAATGDDLIEWTGLTDGTADPFAVLVEEADVSTTATLYNVLVRGCVKNKHLLVDATAPTVAQLDYLRKFGIDTVGHEHS